MNLREAIYETKGTIIRLVFHGRSGNTYRLNPILLGAGGFVRDLKPGNPLLPFTSSLTDFHRSTLVFLDDQAQQVHLLRLELREELTGIQPLVVYPDGSTWEGLVGQNLATVRAMIWSPTLADKLQKQSAPPPWSSGQDWKAVPTSVIINVDGEAFDCSQQTHSCCDPCK